MFFNLVHDNEFNVYVFLLVSITNFEKESVREMYKLLIRSDMYASMNLEDIVIDFTSYCYSSLSVHYKCECTVFDDFDLCATVKHIY
jgi:hypothetical protein